MPRVFLSGPSRTPRSLAFVGVLFGVGISIMTLVLHNLPPRPHDRGQARGSPSPRILGGDAPVPVNFGTKGRKRSLYPAAVFRRGTGSARLVRAGESGKP
jgi:hypothetical protein